MKGPAFYPLSLILIVLVAALVPLSIPWRALGGGLLLALWLAGLAGVGRQAAGYLPGHALLFLGLGLVGAEAALYAWLVVPPLSLALELVRKRGKRYLGAVVYGILWLDLFACLHQLVAVGRGLSGSSLWAWSAGIGAVGLGFVALGIARLVGSPGGAHEPGPGTG
ncbi:hypothetical protein DRJ54_07840 [Candidatus Acetothermia bacterium]|nr:MAG: hypothetical protein DRJ54_07840 [Candidatus Acetothermia bacterium]